MRYARLRQAMGHGPQMAPGLGVEGDIDSVPNSNAEG